MSKNVIFVRKISVTIACAKPRFEPNTASATPIAALSAILQHINSNYALVILNRARTELVDVVLIQEQCTDMYVRGYEILEFVGNSFYF